MHTGMEIKRIDVWSLFKMGFVIYAVIGLVAGLVFAFFATIVGGLGVLAEEADVPEFGLLGGVLGIFAVPVAAFFYGAVGSVFLGLIGVLYNIAARFTGGLKLSVDLDKNSDVTTTPETRRSQNYTT